MEGSSGRTVPLEKPRFKRDRNGEQKRHTTADAPQSPFMPMFEVFREELDQHHDRRERIIKASRDITALSKKMVRTLNAPIPEAIAKESGDRFLQIKALLASIEPDLRGVNAWRYQRQVSGGVQELMEALTFQHYIQHQALLTPAAAQIELGDGVVLTGDDYLLGVFDLVGEMMRFAITGMATQGKLPASAAVEADGDTQVQSHQRTILSDLQDIRAHFEGLDTSIASFSLSRDADKKMEVLKTCVEKVETAVYGMIVRGQERPKGWVPDFSSDAPPVESY